MGKKLYLAIVLIFLSIPAFTQQGLNFNFNAGNMGIGANFPFDDTYDVEAHFSLISFGMEDSYTNLGFAFSPFVFTGWTRNESGEIMPKYEGVSLLNLTLYWNAFNGESLYFGPFASINYLYFDKELYWDKFIFTAGIQLGMRLNFNSFNYNLFIVEAGYKNISGTSKYYVSGKVDIITLFLSYLFSE